MLAVTAFLFPLLYLTLELPKRIINDAIGAQDGTAELFGFEIGQVTLLAILCAAFLLAVLAHGLTKMRINTMKGILAERMLRRFRYRLIGQILRFPQPYLRNTSQGELVSMITAEAEPMGGMMGDAISQPVLQAGQMLTILAFLFAQSVWFGLASITLIPLQAWLIPRLQRRINLHNKERIQEVRRLAGEIGQSAAGAPTLRVSGGWPYWQALVSERLGRLFDIRLQIYLKKFFMKFLNNFITQLTPFFFLAVGGYLVIVDSITLGALVAALAAYKDLSAPWKELLAWYNQVQELTQRWELIVARFAPSGMVGQEQLDDPPDPLPRLSGDIALQDVSVRDIAGASVLHSVSASLGAGQMIGVAAEAEEDRQAMADLLTREAVPSRGRIEISGKDLKTQHQAVVAARIGRAEAQPYVFAGTFGKNMLMPLLIAPQDAPGEPRDAERKRQENEARRTGNSVASPRTDWTDARLAGLADRDAVIDWWLALSDHLGAGPQIMRCALDRVIEASAQPELTRAIVALRPQIAEALAESGLDALVHPFDEAAYNPALPVGGNLLFAVPRGGGDDADPVTAEAFLAMLRGLGLEKDILKLALDVVEMLNQTFGTDGTEHPLFRQLGLDPERYRANVDTARKAREGGGKGLADLEVGRLLTLPMEISAEQIGPAFSEDMKALIVRLRKRRGDTPPDWLTERFEPLSAERYADSLSILENAAFGKLSAGAGAQSDLLRDAIIAVFERAGLRRQVAELILDLPVGAAGAGLPAALTRPLGLARAMIKRPDILVLDGIQSMTDDMAPGRLLARLRHLLPDATIIVLAPQLAEPDAFDQVLTISNGSLEGGHADEPERAENAATADLNRKMRALAGTELFATLPRRQLRLLAFGARWYEAAAGTYVFHRGDDATDGTYLILAGKAGIYAPGEDGARDTLVATAEAGELVGELGLIRGVPRALDMKVEEDLKALRLGEAEFLAVVQNDAATAYKILQVVAGYVG